MEFVACDVREEAQVQAAVEQAAAAEGGLRIAICCAGTGWAQKVAGSKGPHPLMPFETIIQINLIGTFNVLRFAASAMIANEPLGGRRARRVRQHRLDRRLRRPGRPDRLLAPPRAAIVGMTLPAARDLAQYGIRVNTIAPGLFDTPLLAALPEEARQKLGAGVPYPQRLGQPAEYAQLACHIVENGCSTARPSAWTAHCGCPRAEPRSAPQVPRLRPWHCPRAASRSIATQHGPMRPAPHGA